MLFDKIGYPTLNSYVEDFFNKLLVTNKTFEYFVDWDKVANKVANYATELAILNSLVRIKDREKHLFFLLKQYPKVVKVIPLLIAERAKNGIIDIFDPSLEEFVTFEFDEKKISPNDIEKITFFCKETGILDLFDKIKDLHDYLLGVEVGIDTNTRKSRSGNIFEEMCLNKLSKMVGSKLRIVKHDPQFSLYPIIGKGRGKVHDIVIYFKDYPRFVIECNFYNVTGSKPISIAESYLEMDRVAKQHGIVFVWVTDGPAWKKMKDPLLRSMYEMDWVFNYKLLNLFPRVLNYYGL